MLASAFLIFAANGLQAGVYVVLIADVADALDLSDGALGLALGVLSAAGMRGVLAAGRVSDRAGRRPVLVTGSIGVAAFLTLLATVESYAALLPVMALGGLCFSFFDISPSTVGGDYERAHGREAMTRLFAGFDCAAAVGAFGSGLALALGASYSAVFAAVAGLLVVFAVAGLVLPLPPGAPATEPRRARPGAALRSIKRGVAVAAALIARWRNNSRRRARARSGRNRPARHSRVRVPSQPGRVLARRAHDSRSLRTGRFRWMGRVLRGLPARAAARRRPERGVRTTRDARLFHRHVAGGRRAGGAQHADLA